MEPGIEDLAKFGVHTKATVWFVSSEDEGVAGHFELWLAVNEVLDIEAMKQRVDRGIAQVRAHLKDDSIHVATQAENSAEYRIHFPISDWPPAALTGPDVEKAEAVTP